jgi:hypothetical protein
VPRWAAPAKGESQGNRMASDPPDPSYAAAISRSDFSKLTAEPGAEVFSYRTLGLAPVFLVMALCALLAFGFTHRRQELHCSRATQSCVVTCDGPLHHTQSTLSLDSVTDARRFAKHTSRKHGTDYGVELRTSTGRLELDVIEPCDGDSPCSQTLHFEQEVRAFLQRHEQLQLDAGYGPFGSLSATGWFLVAACLFGFVTRNSVVVALSAERELVAVSYLHFGLVRRRCSFRLAAIQRCVIGGSRGCLELVLTDGRRFAMTPRDNLYGWKRRRFADAMNGALTRLRAGVRLSLIHI